MSFDQSINYVLKNEAGFVDNPKDPGGRTNFGISQKLLDGLDASQPDHLKMNLKVEDMDVEQAKTIYARVFWVPMQLDRYDFFMATAMLDVAVNQGQKHSIMAAQAACGFFAVDGVMGPKTIAALLSVDEYDWLQKFLLHVQVRYVDVVKENPDLIQFLEGWLARSLRLLSLVQFP